LLIRPDEYFPIRKNAITEPLPVRFLFDLPQGTRIEIFKDRIRIEALENLTSYKDVCAYPQQCRYFSVEVSDEPYFTRSLPPKFQRRYKPAIPRKLYTCKRCNLNLKGFRRIRQDCPSKSVKELMLFEQEEKGTHTSIRHEGIQKDKS
jgi:hypothetical protein